MDFQGQVGPSYGVGLVRPSERLTRTEELVRGGAALERPGAVGLAGTA